LEELIDTVRWAAGGSLSLEVKAPPAVTAELLEQKGKNQLLVHLLNYNVTRSPAVESLEVDLRIPESKEVSQVSLLTPDTRGTQSLSHTFNRGRVGFTVPRLETYSVASVQLA
jgi:hypothetical protein